MLLVWIGLMGVAAAAAVFFLLRFFPRAFSESGPAVALPWRKDTGNPARVRAWLLLAAAVLSAGVVLVGLISLLS